MSYYLKLDSHIRIKVKVELDLSNYATKKEFKHAIYIKSDFMALKAEVDKLNINNFNNVPTSLNKLNKWMI